MCFLSTLLIFIVVIGAYFFKIAHFFFPRYYRYYTKQYPLQTWSQNSLYLQSRAHSPAGTVLVSGTPSGCWWELSSAGHWVLYQQDARFQALQLLSSEVLLLFLTAHWEQLNWSHSNCSLSLHLCWDTASQGLVASRELEKCRQNWVVSCTCSLLSAASTVARLFPCSSRGNDLQQRPRSTVQQCCYWDVLNKTCCEKKKTLQKEHERRHCFIKWSLLR